MHPLSWKLWKNYKKKGIWINLSFIPFIDVEREEIVIKMWFEKKGNKEIRTKQHEKMSSKLWKWTMKRELKQKINVATCWHETFEERIWYRR